MLAKLIQDGNWQQVLVFTRTKHGANRLAAFLNDNRISAAAIHGNKSQGARTKALADFKSGDIRVLVATDIAARGIDIPQLPQVVNFELPKVAEDYVHRIGRTGRAGETGKSHLTGVRLEAPELFAIERLIQELLPRHELQGFKPSNEVPESKLDTRPIKAKKPKNRSNHKQTLKAVSVAQQTLRITGRKSLNVSLASRNLAKKTKAIHRARSKAATPNQTINKVSLKQTLANQAMPSQMVAILPPRVAERNHNKQQSVKPCLFSTLSAEKPLLC